MLDWLLNDENRGLLSWLGGGIVVVVGGLWTAFKYFNKSSESSSTTAAPITVGNIQSDGDTLVGSGTIDKSTTNVFGVSDIELAEQLGVAKSAVKNFLKLLDQKQIPIDQWDHALRQLAERYKELQQRAGLLGSEDPQVAALQEQAKQAIEAAEFEKAEGLLEKAVELDNAAAEKFKAHFIQRKRSAADSQGLKAKSLHTRFALPEAVES